MIKVLLGIPAFLKQAVIIIFALKFPDIKIFLNLKKNIVNFIDNASIHIFTKKKSFF